MTRPDAGPLAAVRKMWRALPEERRRRRAPAAGGCATWSCGCAGSSSPRSPSCTSRAFPTAASRSSCGATASWRAGIAVIPERFLPTSGSWPNSSRARTPGCRSCSRRMKPRPRANPGCARRWSVSVRSFPTPSSCPTVAPYFDPNAAGQGRPLTAGFHLMQGYFRDDEPLCDLILDERGRRELDRLWHELNFVTLAPMRQYRDFIFFERAEPPRFMREAEFDFARSEDKDATSAGEDRPAGRGVPGQGAQAGRQRRGGGGDQDLFRRHVGGNSPGRAATGWPPSRSHLDALVEFAERAYRRPLSAAERDDLLAFYRQLRREDDLGHEEALRDTLVSVLMSPHFCYRIDLAEPGADARPLSDYALASRLSYFLWSSMPDAELLAHAAAGDLHQPDVLTAQTRRMLRDPRVRGLATEFGGNWLDFRRFEEHNAVDRERFPSFTNELRQAMFEEPIRYFDRYGKAQSLRPRPALRRRHIREPRAGPALRHARTAGTDEWVHVEDARRYGRGGLLPMAVFLTKNAPGLRTSPVKRGYWVVRRLLGEADSAAAADRARAAEGRGEPGRVDPAAGSRPSPRGQELRRLPQPFRFGRPGLRGLRSYRRTAAQRTWAAGRSIPPRPSPMALSGRGWRVCATTCATSGRTISSITCAGSCFRMRWAAACCRRTRRRSKRCGRNWRRTGMRSAVWWKRS